jgi:hypothetical protein
MIEPHPGRTARAARRVVRRRPRRAGGQQSRVGVRHVILVGASEAAPSGARREPTLPDAARLRLRDVPDDLPLS